MESVDQVHRASVALDSSSSDTLTDLSTRCSEHPTPPVGEPLAEQVLGLWISNLLWYGVWLASMTVFAGGVIYLIRHGMEPVDYQTFRGEPDAFRSPSGIINAVLEGRGRGVIQLGLLILIATPVLRVILSLLFFISKRDLTYILITGLVITGLAYSLLGSYL